MNFDDNPTKFKAIFMFMLISIIIFAIIILTIGVGGLVVILFTFLLFGKETAQLVYDFANNDTEIIVLWIGRFSVFVAMVVAFEYLYKFDIIKLTIKLYNTIKSALSWRRFIHSIKHLFINQNDMR